MLRLLVVHQTPKGVKLSTVETRSARMHQSSNLLFTDSDVIEDVIGVHTVAAQEWAEVKKRIRRETKWLKPVMVGASKSLHHF